MCGIAGILDFKNKQINSSDIKKMMAAIAHRGPDGEGFFLDENIALGHRRLSIIDLTDNASQPMVFGSLSITYNGEIYNYLELKEELQKKNYSFSTQSDTEVLLKAYHCYGDKLLSKLDGMFAFAIWDNEKQELFCARDRFGEKPFYYYYNKSKFVFASEMKAIFAQGIQKVFDNKMIFNYLAFDIVENPLNKKETFYKNIYKLEAGTFLKIKLKSPILNINKYWSLDSLTVNKDIKINDAIDKFTELFQISINRRLRSDVNVGTSLSGGLDSSSVSAVINNILLKEGENEKQNTFSARFHDKKLDEGKFIDEMVNAYGFNHHEIFVTDDILLENFDKIIYHQEEPFGSASIVAQWSVMKLAKENNTTVLLDGQGADEILAGYHKYFDVFLKELYLTDKTKFNNQKKKIQTTHNLELDTGLKFLFETRYPKIKKQLAGVKHKLVGLKDFDEINSSFANAYFDKIPFENFNNLNKSLKYDTQIYGLEKLLRFADRNAMAHSIEIRLPFLYHKLVEFLFTLPSEFKINDIWTKYILRKSMNDILPDKITWRIDKMGYQAPQNIWLSQNKIIKEKLQDYKQKLVADKLIKQNFNDKWKILMLGEYLSI